MKKEGEYGPICLAVKVSNMGNVGLVGGGTSWFVYLSLAFFFLLSFYTLYIVVWSILSILFCLYSRATLTFLKSHVLWLL